MSVTAILERARALGVGLYAKDGRIKVRGPSLGVKLIFPVVQEHKPELLEVLAIPTETSTSFPWLPVDPEAAQEVLEERIGILMTDGMPEAQAAQEAVWQLERARCWQRFQNHARIILEAPRCKRDALIDEYRQAAACVFGPEIANHMAATMRSWVTVKRGEVRPA